ncbi:MAG: molybdenum cofactor guanylyltransferase [Deinococcus sp.]|uniref:molybdenum cofactor guanylyltransferase n=1 Tax=Deinococcus sp. TaxID=47478 RepID=UPI0026DCD995|nr:molybdenum cofactor guanylyltransferase [Deinococcus sp.]MDO4247170.1 molybdenum cofactor guanylyltransferase [Deinococcus sp.]
MPEPLTAAITAGGQSSRFGSDKARAEWRGRPLLWHVAASFPAAQARLLLGPPGKYALAGWDSEADLRPGLGPLAGLETALTLAPAGWVAFAGVDNPCLTSDYWEELLAARRPGVLSVQAGHPERGPQPLGALYHTDLRPHISALLDRGERRLRLAAPPERTVVLSGLPLDFFQNVNRPADLAELQQKEEA